MSEQEMVLKKERMMRGRRHNLTLGKSGGGRPLFGYTTNKDKEYISDPVNSKIIFRIFNEYAYNNKSIRKLCRELLEDGLFPNTRFLTLMNDVNNWLKLKSYTGCDKYPQIISKKLFEDVQESLVRNKTVRVHKKPNNFLLKGKLRDSNTRLLLSINSCTDLYYSKRYSGVCVSKKNIDPLIWNYSKSLYDKYYMDKDKLKKDIEKEQRTISNKICVLQEKEKNIGSKIDKVEERMIFGSLSRQRGEDLIVNLKEELSEVENRIFDLTNLYLSKDYQKLELFLNENISGDIMTNEEKIKIIENTIENIFISRINRSELKVKIYNKVNDKIHIYKVYCWKQKWELVEVITRKEDPDNDLPIPSYKTKPKHY